VNIYFVETEESEHRLFAVNFKQHEVHFVSDLSEVGVNAEVLSISFGSVLRSSFLDQHPSLKLVTTRSSGYDHIDLAECQQRGISVCFVPSYGDHTVAEHTFALILALSRRTREAREKCKRGSFSYRGTRGFDLKGKTLGVIGAGKIGLHVIRLAEAFEMEVLAYDICQQSQLQDVFGFRYVPLDELQRRSDIISLHAPLTPATYHLLNREAFCNCRHGVLIINTARGHLIDTDALIEALDDGTVAGAGLDVIEEERVMTYRWSTVVTEGIIDRMYSSSSGEEAPIQRPERIAELQLLMHNADLIARPNVVFTPHIAFNSVESVARINQITIDNICAFLAGKPINVAGKAAAPQHANHHV